MADLPDPIPRDDRSWPRDASFFSLLMVLAAICAAVGLVIGVADRGPFAVAAVVAGFVGTFAFVFAVSKAASRAAIARCPDPPGSLASRLAPVLAFVIGVFDRGVGVAMLVGWIGGVMLANLVAIRAARANRAIVDTANAAWARAQADAGAERRDVSAAHQAAAPPAVPVGQALRDALSFERRRTLAWLVAGVLVVATGSATSAAFGTSVAFTIGGAFFAVPALAWVTPRLCGAWLAYRHFATAATSPRRAFVVLLADPNPYTDRPLLGVWSNLPTVRDGRLVKPERVYRCDDKHDALLCRGHIVVHEAWVDTGPRRTSTPRWVAADAGIALPHRRSLVGWYMAAMILGERPSPPAPLTRQPPHPNTETPSSTHQNVRSFPTAVAWRGALLVAADLLSLWITFNVPPNP